MKNFFRLSMLLTFSILLLPKIPYATAQDKPEWRSICPDSRVSYCLNVGKPAYSKPANRYADEPKYLGRIVGVTWKEKDTVIKVLPKKVKTASEDAHYYIIDDGWNEPFLEKCQKVDVK